MSKITDDQYQKILELADETSFEDVELDLKMIASGKHYDNEVIIGAMSMIIGSLERSVRRLSDRFDKIMYGDVLNDDIT